MKNTNSNTNAYSGILFRPILHAVETTPGFINSVATFSLILLAVFCLSLPIELIIGKNTVSESLSIASPAKAGNTYYNFTGGNSTLNITPSTTDLISSNDDWSGVASIEGYCGNGLTATHGVDPQTVLGTEFPLGALPTTLSTCVHANKGNPSAFNTGGITEFDRGEHLGIGFQGNVQSNPYLVVYLNTTGQNYVRISYDVTDIDGGSNNSVSPVALQYRIGETGNFTNIPAGFVADATDGPNIVGRKTSKSVILPAAASNQSKVQVRLISTNAAGLNGASTPDEWIGINNIVVTNVAPTAASVSVGGRVTTAFGRPISRTYVSMQDSMGNSRMVMTNSFGYYRFGDVVAGESYIFTAFSKRYVFSEPIQVFNVTADYDSLNFVAQP